MKKKMFSAIPVILAVAAFLAFGASSVLAANSSKGSGSARGSDDLGARLSASIQQLVEKVSNGMGSEHFGQAHFTGKVESITGDVWMIAGKKVTVDSHTNLVQSPKVNDMVLVNATVQSDGSFLARVIKTITSQEQTEPKLVVFVGKVASINGSDWMVGDKKVVTDSATKIVGSPVVGDMVLVKSTLQSDGSYLASEIRKLTPEEENGEEMVVTGKVTSFTSIEVVVNGTTFKIDTNTEVDGTLADGVMVRIEAVKETDGSMLAQEIQVISESDEGMDVGEHGQVELAPGDVNVPLNHVFVGVVPGSNHGRGNGH